MRVLRTYWNMAVLALGRWSGEEERSARVGHSLIDLPTDHDASDLGMLEGQQRTFLRPSNLCNAGRLCSENQFKWHMHCEWTLFAHALPSHLPAAGERIASWTPPLPRTMLSERTISRFIGR
jgi:hypothetical protein